MEERGDVKVYRKIILQKLAVFRNVDGVEDVDLEIPTFYKNRTVTDKKGIFLFIIALTVWISVFIYFYTTEKFEKERQKDPYGPDFWKYCRHSTWKYLFIALITIGLCTAMLYIIKSAPMVLININIFFSIVFIISMASFSWYFFSQNPGDHAEKDAKITFALFVTFVAILITVASCVFYEEICLISQLFKEAVQVLLFMPHLLMPTFLIAFFQLAILANAVYFSVPLIGVLRFDLRQVLMDFTADTFFLLLFHVFMTNWTMQFLAGFQCMVVAGSVGSWYFAENKNLGAFLVRRNCAIMARFHVGTIAYGAFLQPMVAFMRRFSTGFSMCLNAGYKMVKSEVVFHGYTKKNAFILSALHGQSYRNSGRRSYALMIMEAPSVVGIRSKADAVSLMTQFFAALLPTFISFLLFVDNHNTKLAVITALLLNVVIVCVLFETLETIVHTLLLCYCEDIFINGDISLPHQTMTRLFKSHFKKVDEIYDERERKQFERAMNENNESND